jgi:hypothetical protein
MDTLTLQRMHASSAGEQRRASCRTRAAEETLCVVCVFGCESKRHSHFRQCSTPTQAALSTCEAPTSPTSHRLMGKVSDLRDGLPP